jgi:hypothetical protein
MQCDVKMCGACRKSHKKIPATREHHVEDLTALTVKKIAHSRRGFCKVHPDMTVELFCPSHKELLCLRCATTTHEACHGKQPISKVARSERAALEKQYKELKASEFGLLQQVRLCKLLDDRRYERRCDCPHKSRSREGRDALRVG